MDMGVSVQEKSCYTAERPDILALIPDSARHILDVGCARGYLGRAIKATRRCEIVGIERGEAAAQEAEQYLDRVHRADAESFAPPYPPGYFDVIVMADILEHLVDPWSMLARYTQYLANDGVAVISVPNVQHYRVVGRLILGRWEYQESGILDSTHLRFFTRKSLLQMMEGAGLEVLVVAPTVRARPIARLLNRLCFNRLRGFLAQQYVVQARRKRGAG